ncbi:Na/Pi symporter [Corynebacterium lowii]|nr:Na/Pi symporter [Corynebacterium lowii]MDP9852629.1 sodium-dependent phosphate cotransporter [Corynebacterium lowii]
MNPKKIPEREDMVMLSTAGKLLRCAGVIACIFAIFLGLYLIVDGMYGMNAHYTQRIFEAATHPILGLVIGILATALLQSSTATTALTVTAVGTGVITVPVAIPLIMGSNIGTTLTALADALGYARDPRALRSTLTTAFLHFWFNTLMVALLLPIELLFQPLVEAIGRQGFIGWMNSSTTGLSCFIIGTLLMFLGLRAMRLLLRSLFAATTLSALENMFGGSTAVGITTGALGTAVIQSSTITIVSLLPFSATHTLKRREALSLVLGANAGTTVGALLASFALPESQLNAFAIQAALIHIFFNVLGVALVLIVPGAYRGLIVLASLSARLAQRSALATLGFLIAAYLAVPALILGVWVTLS